jgi:hypothetical protein
MDLIVDVFLMIDDYYYNDHYQEYDDVIVFYLLLQNLFHSFEMMNDVVENYGNSDLMLIHVGNVLMNVENFDYLIQIN